MDPQKHGLGPAEQLPLAPRPPPVAILVVDDNPANLVALDALMHELGFQVVLTNSGSEALKRLSEGTFACVLLDVRMPGIDGFETAALIRKREPWKDLPILFMTSAEPSLLDYTLGYSLGAVDFITRPLASEIIKGKVGAITRLYLERESARRERDEALRRNQEHLASVLGGLPIAVWATDENLVFTSCGGAIFGQGGIPPAETFMGKALPGLFMPGRSEGAHPALSAHLEALKGQPVRYESDWEGRSFEGHVRPLMDASGRVRGVLGAAVDITERRQAQNKLSAALAELAHVTDAVPALISYINQDSTYAFVNKAYQEWFGKPPEYFLGRHARDILGAEAFAKLRPHFEAALSGHRVTFETEVPYKDWPSRHISATYVPHLLGDGRVAGFVALVTDISDHRQRQEAQAKRYEVLSRISPVGIFQTDTQGDCLSVNRRWTEISGLAINEAQGQGWTTALHPEDRERVRREWYAAARDRRDFRCEYRFLRADGRSTWVLGQAAELRDSSGTLYGYVGTVTDISELREAGAKLQSANKDLEAFVSSVSHDLRAPLRGMSVMAQLLLETYAGQVLDAEGQGYAKRIVEQSGRLDQMTLDLLDYSRVSSAEAPLEPIDLAAILQDTLAAMAPETASRKARIEGSGLSDRVLGNRVLVHQIFSNLLSNAIKFVGPGVEPRVRITGAAHGDSIRVCVEDNGIGILPENQGKLFRLFERIHSEEEYPGTGVGLAIVKRAAERMGSRVGFDRGQNGGSSFWFELRRA